jgi:DNA-binding response OmpR family regulator
MAALRVLVVEDDAMIAMFLAEMLENMGYQVCGIAATEKQAGAVATRYAPGLMIVDEHLREGTGASAIEQILLSGTVPCVLISGVPVNWDRQGATVLRKPFSIKGLVRAIETALGDVNGPKAIRPVGVVLDH